MKFTLIADTSSGAKITHEFDSIYLPTTLEHIDSFIKASGFVPKGELIYAEDDIADESEVSNEKD